MRMNYYVTMQNDETLESVLAKSVIERLRSVYLNKTRLKLKK
jgi:hypothetical protein